MRTIAAELGRGLGKAPILEGSESPEAWFVKTGEATRLFGYPTVLLSRMTGWVADWVGRGMPSLGKATRYDRRTGQVDAGALSVAAER